MVTVRSGKAQGAEPQNGGGMTTRSRENGYERQCNMLHGGVVACGATYYVEIVIGDRTETVACGLGIAQLRVDECRSDRRVPFSL